MEIRINGVLPPVQPKVFRPVVMDLDDAETTGRTADGTLFRDRIAVKRQFEVEWPAMPGHHLSTILQMLSAPFVDVTYPDPETGGYETKSFYPGNRQTEFLFERNGVVWWSGLTVTLTER